MAEIPLSHALVTAALLFSVGVVGVLVRRNLIFVLMSIELMLNAAGLAFIAAGSAHGQADGQAMMVFIIVMAAAEVAVGLGLVLAVFRRIGSLDSDRLSRMNG
jgi:NADH-quinone oxidoreductase subunit K